jgi:hypothetical protein
MLYFALYGELPLVFGTRSQALLSRQGDSDLRRLLRDEARS